MDLSGGELFQSLLPFFENNSNLCKLVVQDCQFGPVCAHQLSLAVRGCNKSLKVVTLTEIDTGGDAFAEIIEALAERPQLEELYLERMNAGRNDCTALVNLLRSTATELHTLDLRNNDIDDEGVIALVGALTNRNLCVLDLSSNRITARGWQNLASLLQNPNCNLVKLDLGSNNVGDEGALIFANALASNRKLEVLDLSSSGITTLGWFGFSKVLCDTSSINNTYRSNHTLEGLVISPNIPTDIRASLAHL